MQNCLNPRSGHLGICTGLGISIVVALTGYITLALAIALMSLITLPGSMYKISSMLHKLLDNHQND